MQVIRTNRKSVSIRINSKAELIIRAPLWASDSEIERIVQKKQDWISKNMEIMLAKIANSPNPTELESLLYLGKAYRVEYIRDKRPYITFTDHFIVSNLGTEQLRQYMPEWYQIYGLPYIQRRVAELSEQYGFKASGVKITLAVHRWGSCSTAGRLCFSWRLLMAAPEVIDYVIIHELSHLIHHNHSKAYWDHVQSIMPDFQIHYRWLKEFGYLLNL